MTSLGDHHIPHLCNLLESHCLDEEVEHMKKMSNHLTDLDRDLRKLHKVLLVTLKSDWEATDYSFHYLLIALKHTNNS
ncbi:hypothetical protein Celaphus_00009580 [Cervus elaphus hippelaphus]|uniref:Uncharacterized protein n=1 Tax=Cervus elaphus hippelaphus TaxID=46360 RepID=A0A212C030_CEREH|nr:hypothetical protein Celaphus_00009580 [Cervus elaphus hippelaphus]